MLETQLFDKVLLQGIPSILASRSRDNSQEPGIIKKASSSVHGKKLGNRVLMIGRVRELALYRAEVLKRAGFRTIIAGDGDEAIQIMQRSGFDAVVLSYTLPSELVQYLTEAAREYCPDCPVVAIAETRMLDRRILPDAVALAEDGPTALLAALRRVMKID